MGNMIKAFTPLDRTTRTMTVSGASSSINIMEQSQPARVGTVRIYNSGSALCFVRFGDSTVTATTADIPLAPGITEILHPQSDATHIATIGTSGSLYVTAGEGV